MSAGPPMLAVQDLLFGHHGWFSLTPVWFLGLAGIAMAVLRENHALGQHDHEGVAHGEVPQW